MLSRVVYRKRRGRRLMTALATLTLVTGSLFAASTALAVHNDGLFELDTVTTVPPCTPTPAPQVPCGDANVADDPVGGADDWENVYKSATGLGTAGPDHAFVRSFISDPVGAAEDSFYTGGGSKDERDISGKNSWQWGNTNDPIPDKDDITNAFAAGYKFDHDADPETKAHTIFYFGMDRYDNNGDAEAGFWFFKNPVSLATNPPNFIGTHTIGDVLVLVNWGGSNPIGEFTVYTWDGVGSNPLTLVSDNLQSDCAIVASTDNACGTVNRTNVDPPWDFLDKGGSSVIRPLELLEAGMDLNALLGGDPGCFSSFLAATRSSHSTTAQLKDFALGQFAVCTPTLTTTPVGGSVASPVTPGTEVYDRLVVQGTGVDDPPEPTGTATFFLCNPSQLTPADTGVCSSGGTNIGTGDLADTSPPPGESTAVSPAVNTAASPLSPGRYCFRSEWPGDDTYKPVPPATKFIEYGTGDSECFVVAKLPSETVTTSTPTGGDVVPGTSVSDSATVTGPAGQPVPTGTVKFFLCQPTEVTAGGCEGTAGTQIGSPAEGEDLDATGVALSESTSNTTALGTYCWRAEYSGNTIYEPSSHTNTTTECFTTVKQPSETVTTSTPTGGDVVPGTSVSDSATVTGPAGQPVPTGTVKFFLCQPTEVTAGGCEGTAGTQIGSPAEGEDLDATGVALSESTSNTTAIGTYCWRAEYSGDARYDPSSHTNTTTECFTTVKQPSETVTTSNPTGDVAVGTSVSDSATVTGGTGQPVPTGTVKFFLCQPIEVTAGGCEGTAGTQIGTPAEGEDLDATGVATSESTTNTISTGTYCWRAEYSGDGFYEPSSHTNATTECFTVKDTTGVTSEQTWLPNDSATITSTGGTALSGTLSFTLFESDDCTGTILYEEDTDAALAGVQPFTISGASPQTKSTTNDSVSVTASTTVSWLSTFTSSDPNVGSSSHCEKTELTITN